MPPTPPKLCSFRKSLAEMEKKKATKAAEKAGKTAAKVAKAPKAKPKASAPPTDTSAEPVKKRRGRPPKNPVKEDTAPEEPDKGDEEQKPEPKAPGVPWAKLLELTDGLVTEIEDNEPRRIALGFTKGDHDGGGKQSGETLTVHYLHLGEKAVRSHPSGKWAAIEDKELAQAVRYRVHALKKKFQEYRLQLKDTGNGIIMAGKEDTLTGDLKNLWEEILQKFPWYKRLYALLADSPIYDEQSCSNSLDDLDADLDAMMDDHSHSRDRREDDVDDAESGKVRVLEHARFCLRLTHDHRLLMMTRRQIHTVDPLDSTPNLTKQTPSPSVKPTSFLTPNDAWVKFVTDNNAGKKSANPAVLVEAPVTHGAAKAAVVDNQYLYQAGFIGPALSTLKVTAVTTMQVEPKPKNRKCCEGCIVM
ncbi:hypothetical protein NMY22_g10854 [Coprinellus aureogranulatus]|nr:hypothetical protein NMY22_g10854 [Coprinellus aureogranulatus]